MRLVALVQAIHANRVPIWLRKSQLGNVFRELFMNLAPSFAPQGYVKAIEIGSFSQPLREPIFFDAPIEVGVEELPRGCVTTGGQPILSAQKRRALLVAR